MRKQLDFIIEFAGYRTKQYSIKQLTARPLIFQKTVFERAVPGEFLFVAFFASPFNVIVK